MRRTICLLLTLCLLAACSLAEAENAPSHGKPYTNPNLYDSFPERPGPEENYIVYADYDSFVRAAAGADPWNNNFVTRSEQYLAQEILSVCRNPAFTDTESGIIRILYALADPEKLDLDGTAPLMARVERLKAVKTTEELSALLQEEGFLLSAPFLYCLETASPLDAELFVVSIQKTELLEYLLTTDNDGERAQDKQDVIESIAADVIDELIGQGLTKANCGDLEKHAYSIQDGIRDASVRNMHILAAV